MLNATIWSWLDNIVFIVQAERIPLAGFTEQTREAVAKMWLGFLALQLSGLQKKKNSVARSMAFGNLA